MKVWIESPLAAYVQASVINAAAHALSRLADVAVTAGGELTTIALRALQQHATATMRSQHAARSDCGDGPAYFAACPVALSGVPCKTELLDSSGSRGEEGGTPLHLALGHVLDLSSAAEALISQLLAEMTKLVVALRAARDAVLTSAIGEADLHVVASRAGEAAKVRHTVSMSIPDLPYPPQAHECMSVRRRQRS